MLYSLLANKFKFVKMTNRGFNSEIRYSIRLRDKLRKKSFKTKSTQDLLLYKCQRNKVNNMKKCAKENYINNISETI